MKSLTNACEALEQESKQANNQCQAIQRELDEIATILVTLPLVMLKLRLQMIICQIVVWTLSLYSHNNGRGFVYVMMTQAGLGVYWGQEEYSAKDKEWFKARGILVLLPEEAVSKYG